MGWMQRAGVWISAAAGWLGLAPTPDTDPERVERIDEMYADYRKEFPEVPSLSAKELGERLERGEDWVLVDTRSASERAVSTLPGAVPAEVVEANPGAFTGKSIVAYCTIGYRSGLWGRPHVPGGTGGAQSGRQRLVLDPRGPARCSTRRASPLSRFTCTVPTWDLARTDFTAVW